MEDLTLREQLRKVEPESYLTSDSLSGGHYSGFGYIAHVNVAELLKIAEESGKHISENIAYCGMASWSLRDCVEEHNSVGFPPALIISEGGYESVTAYVHPEWTEGVEAIEALENYPVLCDEALSAREAELEDECWESYTESDLKSEVLGKIEDTEIHDLVEVLLDDGEFNLRGAFMDACEFHNVYPEFEGAGQVYYPGFPEIGDTLRDYLLIEVDTRPEAAAYRAARDGLIAELPLGVH